MAILEQAGGAAPPFNTINPSGVDANTSFSNLTQIALAARERALARQKMGVDVQQAGADRQQQERQFQQNQDLQREDMTQRAALTREDLALREKQMREAAQARDDENSFRILMEQKSENATRFQQEQEMADEHFDQLGGEARAQFMREYLAKRSAATAELDALQRQMVGLQSLKAFREGLYSKNLTDPNGIGIGVQMLKAMQQQSQARVLQLDPARQALKTALETLVQDPAFGGEVSAVPGGGLLQKIGDVVGSMSLAQPTEFGKPSEETQAMLRDDPERAKHYGLDGQATSSYATLAESLAQYVHGAKVAPGALVPRIQMLLTVLDKAENGTTQAYEKKELRGMAARLYQDMQKDGVDTDTLDRLMWSASEMKKDAAGVAAGTEGAVQQQQLATTGKIAKGVDGVLSGSELRLKKMLAGYSFLKDAEGQRLVKGWGNDQFYDLSAGKSRQFVEEGLLSVLGAVTGTKDPYALVQMLKESDPASEAEVRRRGLGIIADMDPEAKREMIRVLEQGIMSYGQEAVKLGVATDPRQAIAEDIADPIKVAAFEKDVAEKKGRLERDLPVEEAARVSPKVQDILKQKVEAKRQAREKRNAADKAAKDTYNSRSKKK